MTNDNEELKKCPYCKCEMDDHNYEHLARYCYPLQIAKTNEVLKIVEERLYEASVENIKKDEMLRVAEEALERHEHIEREGCRECEALGKIKQMREGKV